MSITVNRTALRFCALAFGLLTMLYILSPQPACAGTYACERIAVTAEGRGPGVALIHGLASSAKMWDAEVAKLKSRYRPHLVLVAESETLSGPWQMLSFMRREVLKLAALIAVSCIAAGLHTLLL